MKVLQINTVCGTGSTGRICVDIANMLISHGDDSLICYGRGVALSSVNSYKICGKLDIYIHAFISRIFDSVGFGSKWSTKRLIRKIKEYNPDIIHLHNLHGYYINIKELFNYLKTFTGNIIWTLHDCWAFTGHCSYFDDVGCDKWRTACYSCCQKKEYPKSMVFDLSKRNFKIKKELFLAVDNMKIVTPSKWLAGLVGQSFLNKFQINVINNGIDINVFKPTENNFKKKYYLEQQKIVLAVANVWDKRKGFYDVISLANLIKKSYSIVMVGLNDKQMKEMPNNIIGIKRTNSIVELAQIFTAADVFINTTYQDNFPTTNLESLACGTPVITYNTGGSSESVLDGYGSIVEKGNLEKMLEEIYKINEKINPVIEFDKNKRFKEYYTIYCNKQ